MPHKIIYSEKALKQLQNIYDYIFRQSLNHYAADKYVNSIQIFIGKLSLFPFIGTLALKNNPKVRTVGFRRRVTIVFLVSDTYVTIAGIYYGGQQVKVGGENG